MPGSNQHLLIGRNALHEVLKHCPERIERVLVADSLRDKSDKAKALLSLIKENSIPVEYLPAEELNTLARSESHQSFVAVLRERISLHRNDFLETSSTNSRALVLMLDSLTDPHNFGAVLRAAECFGVDAVTWSKNRGVGLTPVVSKVSAGASELVPLMPVSNLVETLKYFKKNGFWSVAADVAEEAVPLTDFEFPEKTVLVLGSEEQGLSPLLLKHCDYHLRIPLMGHLNSLNVSQAAAVLLYAYRAQCDSPRHSI